MREPLEKRNTPAAAAFTLVELLVAMGVLILLLVMVTQIVTSASQATTQSGKHMDADTQARVLFDRMAVDFANLVNRSDVDSIFYTGSQATGNDKIFFFSQAPAYYDSDVNTIDKSSVALVGYRVTDQNGDLGNSAPAYSLERLGQGLTWEGIPSGSITSPGSMVFATGTSAINTLATAWKNEIGAAPTYTTGTSTCYHVMADQVFRMEICFQVKEVTASGTTGAVYSNYPVAVATGTNTTTINSGTPSGGKSGDRWYDTQNSRAYLCTGANSATAVWRPNGLKDVVSIVVTIAILDNTSRKITGGNLSNLVTLFTDPTAADLAAAQLPAQTWQAALQTALKNNSAGIPKAAAGQIRIYQRHFYLNNNTTL